MRYRNTKERKQERREFIYQYREEMQEFFQILGWSYYIGPRCDEFIQNIARPHLGYGEKCANGTIYRALACEYVRMKEKGLL